MLKNQRTFCAQAALLASITTISMSVSAAINGPVEVTATSHSTQSGLLTNVLTDRLVLANNEDRYIVTFNNTGAAALTAPGKQASGTGSNADDGFDVMAAKNILQAVGATTHKVLANHKMVAASMDKAALNALRQNPNVADVSPDPRRHLMAQTTPYGINMVQASQFSQSDLSARTVCVIDTGYNRGHADLPNTNGGVSGNANNSAVGNWYNDGNGHGTHVAGTIAAYDNSQGVVGVYPGVDLHIVKIFDDNGTWTYASDIVGAIDQCKSAGANVVNMSLGGAGSSSAENAAMQGFADDGILLVAAAGNDGNSSQSYPASYDAVMSVAAVDSNANHASYSQYNSAVEIAGPGSSVYSTYPTNTYATLSGTSMATPHVVGAAALVWSYFPQCSNTQIRSALNATAQDRGASGRDNYYGYGIVKVANAVDYLNANGCSGNGGGDGGGTPPDTGVEPVSGEVTGLSGSTGSWKRYTWDVPAGVTTMTVRTAGGSGDADLYVRLGAQPTTSAYDCRPYKTGNGEVCTFSAPSQGTWHIGIRAYSTYSGVTMSYSYE
ncbi:S8 family serine peptidase [Salinimonas sediminis]|uniref:Peptidase S8 n=1 Tax=Salinimonas sediminis TaxID=2303538 RepID=A0A346NQR4_9ALTE|nr:S8 family serine peptidase [Salinimonas sediminis]AXR07871.1 peptidase S8 [Salinimonas sediminis]